MIKPAQIEWSDDTPISPEFDDVYFSKASGIEETRYVFLEQNHLPTRWNELLSPENTQGSFTIVETGFGTGLNFLCAWDLWHQTQQQKEHKQDKWLHFVTVEKFPLLKESLTQALAHWPELSSLSEKLLNAYPPLIDGWHRIEFTEDKVVLHIYLGDIKDWLPNIQANVDAWFLDGFAPSKNPEMWDDTLFQNMSRLTALNGTAATFTCAGLVKRGLKGAGFDIRKVKGFGRKREMLTAKQTHSCGPKKPSWLVAQPWLQLPKTNTASTTTKTAVVIGGGIAGCSSAYALAQRGFKVTLLEKNNNVANAGSGNPQGVLYAKLSSDLNAHSQFYLAGYLHSLRNLHQTMPDKTHWNDCGVLQLAFNEKEAKRQAQFNERHALNEVVEYVTPEQATEFAGTQIEQSGLYFPNGGWVSPKHWCKALTNHENIEVVTNCSAETLEQADNQHWLTHTKTRVFESHYVIVASAQFAKTFEQLSFLPTKSIPGQITQASTENESVNLKTVLCGSSYVAPQHKNQLVFGASYRLKSLDESVLDSENTSNVENLNNDFPSVGNQLTPNTDLSGRAATRCTVPDYTPIAGPILKEQEFLGEFADLKKSKNWKFQQSAKFHNGLYVNCGHGSRGLSSAPLCGELIAAQINEEPWPIQKKLADVISPSRFLIKLLIG